MLKDTVKKLAVIGAVAGMMSALAGAPSAVADSEAVQPEVETFPRAGFCGPTQAVTLGKGGEAGAAKACAPHFTGQALVTDCGILHAKHQMSLKKGKKTEEDERAAAACQYFLEQVIEAAGGEATAGKDIVWNKPDSDETVCFRLPSQLTYRLFADLVVAEAQMEPTLLHASALEMGLKAIASAYPCAGIGGEGAIEMPSS